MSTIATVLQYVAINPKVKGNQQGTEKPPAAGVTGGFTRESEPVAEGTDCRGDKRTREAKNCSRPYKKAPASEVGASLPAIGETLV